MISLLIRLILAVALAALPVASSANMPGSYPPIINQPETTGPNTYFKVVTYTGNGSTQAITGLGFSPGFVITKSVPFFSEWLGWDTLRGPSLGYRMTTTGFAQLSVSGVTSFDADGFTLGSATQANNNGTLYVALAWRNGSSQFWMERYTGNGNNSTLRSHSLGVLPFMLFSRDTAVAADTPMQGPPTIPSTSGSLIVGGNITANLFVNGSNTTSSVYNPAQTAYANNNGNTYNMGYLFGALTGYSASGTYTGNASASGPTVTTGFQPSMIMIQRADATLQWSIIFKARNAGNPATNSQRFDSTLAEQTGDVNLDILTTGFQIKSATLLNTNAISYFWVAYK